MIRYFVSRINLRRFVPIDVDCSDLSSIFILFFKEFRITTFDSGLARSFGIAPAFFSYLLMTQVSTTAIGAFRAVGVLMVLAFITLWNAGIMLCFALQFCLWSLKKTSKSLFTNTCKYRFSGW